VAKPEQWARIKEIVGAAIERGPGEREIFLNEACGPDAGLRAEVESLLSAYESPDALAESALTTQEFETAEISRVLGPYRLLRKLGEGGMGQVWLAEQTSPVHRTVALKLVKAGMYDESALRRFQSERQSLAIMEHPYIAKVLDAGATPGGQPYFVMEYVQGVCVTEYCDKNKLRIRERLELFIQICEGVQHAHQKAIIHRDLKPANILVVEVDGKPVPRIIDFGLAKAVDPFRSQESMNTQPGGFVGTPGYMSPEQADPDVRDVDTRADVYSLGVVLYELLTGYLPFDTTRWKKMRFEEVLKQMREEVPPRPSTRVQSERDTSTAKAQARGTEPQQLEGVLQGDLDWITLKALDKDRNRRYGTPFELAAEIHKYFRSEPILARPAGAGYRLQKYIRRHRVAVGVATAFGLLLIGFAAIQAVQLKKLTRERDRADREASTSKEVSNFLLGLFRVSDPSEARGNSITARELLDKGTKQMESSLTGQPDVKARLMSTMGDVYASLGLYDQAQPLLTTALDTRRHLFGAEHPDTLRSMDQLSRNLERQGRYVEAEKLVREAMNIRKQTLPPDAPENIASQHRLGALMLDQGHFADAEKINRQVLDAARRVLGPEDPATVKSLVNLGMTLADEGRDAEAEKYYRQALEIQQRLLGPQHPDTLVTMTSLARSLSEQGKYAEAESLLRESLATKLRVLGPEHSETLWTMHDLGINLRSSGHLQEAEIIDRETLEIRRRVLGPEHPETLMSMVELAETLDDRHRYAEAEKLYRETLAIEIRVRGADHPGTALTKYNLACNLALTGHRDEALQLLRDALDHGLSEANSANMETDTDLNSLHGDPRFAALIALVKKRLAAQAPKTN
jgi:serine/threonine protein kinase